MQFLFCSGGFMTNDAILVLGTLFNTIWRLFTSWYIPGTNGVTPAMAFLFFIAAGIGLRFVHRVLGLSPDFAGASSAVSSASNKISSRSGNPRLIRDFLK